MSLKKVHFSEKTALRIVNGAQEGYIRTRLSGRGKENMT